MNYKQIKEKVKSSEQVIYARLDSEMNAIKQDYLGELNNDYEEEKDDYDTFADYLEYNVRDYVDFALGNYLLRLIEQTCNISGTELKVLTSDEKCELIFEYIKYFMNKSEIEEAK